MQRIRNGELTGVTVGDGKPFALILLFCTPPYTRPVRPHAVARYMDIPAVRAVLDRQKRR